LTSLKRIAYRELEKESLREGFWNDPNKAKAILQEQSRLNDAVTNWKNLRSNVDDLGLLYQMTLDEHDEQAQKDIGNELERLNATVRSDELKMMLASEQDAMNAIMSIHAGAGGRKLRIGRKCSCGCICAGGKKRFCGNNHRLCAWRRSRSKECDLDAAGDYAYGYAKAEIGIHRL